MRLFLVSIICLISLAQMAQEVESKNNLLLDGFLKTETGETLPKHQIDVKSKDGNTLELIHTDVAGRFKVYFPFDEIRELWFSKAGYHTKILVVDTRNVPHSERKWGYEYGGFNVKLESIGLGNHAISRVAAIRYSPEVENFDFEILTQ
ncbi:MAG: hypothetical protein Salg2KO_01210 [Salibacteraceae bacterium]